MTVELVFPLTNGLSQDNSKSVGICTAASYAWAKSVLKKGKGLNKRTEFPDDHTLNAQMRTIRRFDDSPKEAHERIGLELVSEHKIASLPEVDALARKFPKCVIIFWNSHHTMGYRYASGCKEYFDMERGLYRSKRSGELLKLMKKTFLELKYEPVIGAYVVKLP